MKMETEEMYSYNELNDLLRIERLTKDNSENEVKTFTYDTDGNMTLDGRGIYKYDSLNRMNEAVMEDGKKLIYRYDAEGLRRGSFLRIGELCLNIISYSTFYQ